MDIELKLSGFSNEQAQEFDKVTEDIFQRAHEEEVI